MNSTTSFHPTRWTLRLGLLGGLIGPLACGGATDGRPEAGAAPSLTPPGPQTAGRDILAVGLGTELRLISIDGASRSVLAGDPFFAGVTGIDLVGGGRFLIVRSYAESSPDSGLRLALVTSGGAVEWTRRFAVSFAGGSDDSALHWGISLGEDGSVVLDDRNSQNFHVAAVGGSTGELPGYFPVGPSIDGFMPVRSAWSSVDPYAVTYAWWRVGAGQDLANVTHSTSGSGIDATDPVSFGGKLVRLAKRDGIVLLVQTASGTSQIPLPQATDAAHIVALGDGEMFAADERWLLVGSGIANRVVRVDLQSSSTETLDLVGPDGYRPFADCQDRPALDSGLRLDRDGRIVRAFRNDDRVAAFSAADGTHWSQVGGSFSGVGGLEMSVARGTYTIHGHRGAYCYTLGPTWSSTANADFVGDWTQIVRPRASSRIAAPGVTPLAYVLSRSGRFGARWEFDASARAATLRIVDVETGVVSNVATDATGIRSAQPVWLWEP